MKAHADLIFENYNQYLQSNNDTIGTPQGAIEMLTSEGSFQAYINALTEGLEPYQRAPVMAVCQRQREMLLEEAAQMGPSASIIGYAVV